MFPALRHMAAALALLFVVAVWSRPAAAQCPYIPVFCPGPTCCDTCCALVCYEHEITRQAIRNEHRHLREEVFGRSAGILPFPAKPNPPPYFWRLQHYELWLIDVFFEQHIQPALMMMTEQLVTVMMQQMLIIGTFFDAEEQQKTQQLFQKLTARVHRDYHPSFGMCEFGSNTRSIGAADFIGDMSLITLNKRYLDRQLGNDASVGGSGPDEDRASSDSSVTPSPFNRLGFFLNKTCDKNDLNKLSGKDKTGLFICADAPKTNGWVNRDLDWNNTVMSPRTINVDFNRVASDNSRLFEMSNYLYGHKVFIRPDGTLLEREQNQDNFMDSRAVIAKRSVAQNSFDALVALKTRGTRRDDPGNPREFSSEDTSKTMRIFMQELGFPVDDFQSYHRYMFHKNEEKPEDLMDTDQDQISYYAQMEMMAKKIYQRPEFYTDLYENPANIKRKSAALQAVKTMLDRDIFDSQIRAEAIMSMILELKVDQEQQYIEDALGLVRERSRE